MKKFIKLTNAVKEFCDGQKQEELEVIINVDCVRTLTHLKGEQDDLYVLVPIIQGNLNFYSGMLLGYLISKEDYEAARKILIDDGSDDHESEQVVEVPAEVSIKKAAKKLITKALIECPDKVSAAEKLGISLESLNSKIQEYGICWPDKNFKQ